MMQRKNTIRKNLTPLVQWAIPAFAIFLTCCATVNAPQQSTSEPVESSNSIEKPSEHISVEAHPEVAFATKRYRKAYVLGPGDILKVVVLKHPDATMEVRVRPDGYITLPFLDDVKTAGLTPMELDQKLTEKLSKRLVNPEVSVIVVSPRPAMLYVIGEVPSVSAVPLREASTVLQAITLAGGFTSKSAKDSVLIIRVTDDGRLTATRINLARIDQKPPYPQEVPYIALQNIPLQADDIIFVPKTFIARVSTWINDHLNVIFTGINSVIGSYANIKLIELLE